MIKSKKQIALVIILPFLFSVFFVFASPANAALVNCGNTATDPSTGQTTVNECQLIDIVKILITIINVALGLSWLLAVFLVFWSGYGMATSWGNAQHLEESKKSFGHAIIGFFLIMIAYILVNFIVYALSGQDISPQGGANSIFRFLPSL